MKTTDLSWARTWKERMGPQVQSTLSLPEVASREGAGPGVLQGRMARGALALGAGRGVERRAQQAQPEDHKRLAFSTL